MYWINGTPQTKLIITDRTIHFGDGFFTTARIVGGDVLLLDLHLERLDFAARRLLFSSFDTDSLRQEMLVAAKEGGDGVLKALVSRGSGSRGYSISGCGAPVRIVSHHPAPTHYANWRRDGVWLRQSPIRLARNKLLAGIKHNNRLEQILICSHLEQTNGDEALVLDTEGLVVECASANLFWRRGREVFTPALRYTGIAGVMRHHVISLLPVLGYTIEEVLVGPEALVTADEAFITNSLLPIAPVKAIDEQRYFDRTLYQQFSRLC